MGIKKPDTISIEAYLEHEYSSLAKHEYERGEVLAMSGGTLNHGILCGNIYSELRTGISKKKLDCTPIGSEVRIHIQPVDAIVYPDAMVICGNIQVSEQDLEAIINPLVVVEVLSKSTGNYDRGDKFYKYRHLSSLKEYILIEQEKPVVESFFKKEDNIWEISRVSGTDQTLLVKSLGVEILLEELYVNVKWPQ